MGRPCSFHWEGDGGLVIPLRDRLSPCKHKDRCRNKVQRRGEGLATLAFSGCSHTSTGFIRMCTPLDWRPRRVLRGRAEGSGRVFRVHIEAPRLGRADVTGKGGEVFSLCACLGVLLSWAGLDALPLGYFFRGLSRAKTKGQVRRASGSGWG